MLALAAAILVFAFVPSATGSPRATSDAGLVIFSAAFGGDSLVGVVIGASDPMPRVDIFVPHGYGVRGGEPVGSQIGSLYGEVSDPSGLSDSVFLDGDLVVDDPAMYAANPSAQACAPGTHKAVWRASLAILGHPFDLPIFVDEAASSSGAAYVLRLCPTWAPDALFPKGLAAGALSLYFANALSVPTDPGRYTWSAFVTPAPAGSLTPEPGRTFEVRAVVPHPHTLTLTARHDEKAKTVVLSGRLMAAGEPRAGVSVSFGAYVNSSEDFSNFGPVTTDASGKFSIRRRIESTTQFSASVQQDSGFLPCTAPSTAPAGCLTETISAPSGGSAYVRVRRAIDAKLVRNARDQALARRTNLKLADFPPNWVVYDVPDFLRCEGFDPKMSDLTVTGEAESPAFLNEQEGFAGSRTSVYLTEAHAQAAFEREAQLAFARCIAKEAEDDDYELRSLGRITFPGLGQATKAFRIVAEYEDEIEYLDLVSFRRGRTVVHMQFAAVAMPLPTEKELAAKVAARARSR